MSTVKSPGRLKDSKDRLYAGFAAGKSNKELADEFGVHVSTIIYHREQWEKAGRPNPAMTSPSLANEAPAATQVPTEPTRDDGRDDGDRPATREELELLAAVLTGKAPRPQSMEDPEPTETSPEVSNTSPVPQIEVGRVYEGAVARVESHFVLVDLIELADMKGRSPRGKVSLKEVGLPDGVTDLRDAKQFGLREGVLVNTQVLSVRPDPHRPGKQLIALSLARAPGHPEGYTPPTHFSKAPKATASATGTQPAPDSTPPASASTPEPAAQFTAAATTLAATRLSLCDSCVKADVCRLAIHYQDEIELGPEDKPDRLASIEIVYGARPVVKCSAYVKAQ